MMANRSGTLSRQRTVKVWPRSLATLHHSRLTAHLIALCQERWLLQRWPGSLTGRRAQIQTDRQKKKRRLKRSRRSVEGQLEAKANGDECEHCVARAELSSVGTGGSLGVKPRLSCSVQKDTNPEGSDSLRIHTGVLSVRSILLPNCRRKNCQVSGQMISSTPVLEHECHRAEKGTGRWHTEQQSSRLLMLCQRPGSVPVCAWNMPSAQLLCDCKIRVKTQHRRSVLRSNGLETETCGCSCALNLERSRFTSVINSWPGFRDMEHTAREQVAPERGAELCAREASGLPDLANLNSKVRLDRRNTLEQPGTSPPFGKERWRVRQDQKAEPATQPANGASGQLSGVEHSDDCAHSEPGPQLCSAPCTNQLRDQSYHKATEHKSAEGSKVIVDQPLRAQAGKDRIRELIRAYLANFYEKYGSFIPLSRSDVLKHLKKTVKTDLTHNRKPLIFAEVTRYQATLDGVPSPLFRAGHNKHTLTLEDLSTLDNQNWVNDQVINMYGELIMEDVQHKVHFFNTFFYKQLETKGYEGVKRWTKKVDLFSKRLLLVPIHLEVHWSLIAVDMSGLNVLCYDSQGTVLRHAMENIVAYIMSEAEEKHRTAFLKGWKMATIKWIPQQKNDNDCGVFLLEYCRCLAQERPLLFSQANMPKIRRRMYKELCEGRLLG